MGIYGVVCLLQLCHLIARLQVMVSMLDLQQLEFGAHAQP